ncbi:MAG: hypothetical protein AB7S26_34650 [Sandaracinaceae bacterium]
MARLGAARCALALLASTLVACEDRYSGECAPAVDAGGVPCDSLSDGGTTRADGGAGGGRDAGVLGDGGPGAVQDGQVGGLEADRSSLACFNGLDDDANLAVDCEELSCETARYCCVGSARSTCCDRAGVVLSATFAGCATGDPVDCGSAPLHAFGTPLPTLNAQGMTPNGDDLGESGVVLARPIALRSERVEIVATIAARTGGCESPTCLDVVSFGLAEEPTLAPHRVTPAVAVMVRASRRDYALVVMGEVVASAPIASDAPTSYRLVVDAEGNVELRAGEADPIRAHVLVQDGWSPMIWGRAFELTTAETPAAVTDVQLTVSGCDIPNALTRPLAAAIPFAGPTWSGDPSSPSVIAEPGGRLAAFEYQGGIHLARYDGVAWSLAGSGVLGVPALAASVNERLEDPELVRESDRYVLYVTRIDAMGATHIDRAEGDAGLAETFGALAPVSLPDEPTRSYRSPSVLAYATGWLMAAVTRGADEPRIVLLYADSPEGPYRYATGDLERSTVVARDADLFHFATDEVADPELVGDSHGLLRLYYAGRRGARWSIGLVVSGGVIDAWRDPLDGIPALDHGASGQDALGVRDPSVVIEGDRLSLFHTASDGVRSTIRRAEGDAP